MRWTLRLLLPILGPLALAAAVRADEGKDVYLSSCAPCHGVQGRGNGPDARFLKQKPSDLRSGSLRTASVDELVAKIRSGRALPLALDTEALSARAQMTESLIAFLHRLPGVDWAQVEPGEVVYSVRCADCHGFTGKPPETLPAGVATPRDLSDPRFQKETSDAELIRDVRHGSDHMPALTPRVSEEDARLIASYVRLFSPGYTTYVDFCMACHGRDGHGQGTLGEEMPLPTFTFDAAYFKRTDPEVLRAKVWHMLAAHGPSMPHYRGLLTDAQIRAAAQYIKHLQ